MKNPAPIIKTINAIKVKIVASQANFNGSFLVG